MTPRQQGRGRKEMAWIGCRRRDDGVWSVDVKGQCIKLAIVWLEKGELWLRCGLCKEIREGGHYKKRRAGFLCVGGVVCEHCYNAPGVGGTREDKEWWLRRRLRNLYLQNLLPFLQ